jgi:hypothetical protein
MKKFNLSEAAKSILIGEGSKETFNSNISSKAGARSGNPDRGNEVGINAIKGSTAYGTQEVGKIGDSPNDVNDNFPDYFKGTKTATPPGATPPVGSEPMKKLAPQPGQKNAGDSQGASSDMGGHQHDETPYDQIRDRKPGKLAPQMMKANKGGVGIQQYSSSNYNEESEYDDEEAIAEEKEEGHEDKAQDKAMIKKMLKKEKMKEDLDALLGGENLSEEFVTKASTIFEAAVIARAEEVIAEAEVALTEQFEVAVEEIKEELASKVDDYLNYMVEEWMKENQLAIEKGLRAEIVEDFIVGLKGLFEEHYIDIPEDKVNVVEELANKVEELEGSLNEQISYGVELAKALNEQKKIEAIYTACEGLTQTQVEKLKSLAEGVEFTTEEEFVTKVETLKESYFKADVKVADNSALDEVLVEDEKKQVFSDPSMEIYTKAISQTLAK